MTKRQQLPPQIKKLTVTDRATGKPVVRYQLTVDAGINPDTGKRRQTRRRFTTEADARDELAKVLGGVATGTYVHANKVTVEAVCAAWLASKHSLKPSTLAGHESKLQALRDELGHVEVQRLTKADLDTLIGRLRRGEVKGRKAWSPRSVNYMLGLTRAVLDDQLKQGTIVRNVAALVDRVPADPKKYRTLTDDEMYRILDRRGRDRHLWTLALYGLRRGELAGLRWSHINLTDKPIGHGDDAIPPRSLRVVENRVTFNSTVATGTPKSKASRRTLPLPDDVVAVLKAVRKEQAQEQLRFGPGYGEGDYVGRDATGKPYYPGVLTDRWRDMLRDMGIARVRLHDARHTCGTLMHLRGVPIAVIAAWLGHHSPAFTMAVYAHSQDDALKAAGMTFQRVVTTGDNEAGSSK
jgi:integrase